MVKWSKIKKALIFIALNSLFFTMIGCRNSKNAELADEPFTIEYILSGGIAGFRDRATIESNGQFKYMTGDKVVSEGVLDEKDIDKLRELAIMNNNFIDKKDIPRDDKVYPDKLTEEVIICLKGEIGTSKKNSEIIEMIKLFKIKYKK